jgi:protein-tyrosine phosphatase
LIDQPIDKVALLPAMLQINFGELSRFNDDCDPHHVGVLSFAEDDVANHFSNRYHPTMPKLLFLCTANYYRSRFAEILFNHLAVQHQLNWAADSRGIVTSLGAGNTGVISENTVNGLRRRGVGVGDHHRSPIQVQTRDFEQTDLVIALDEQEHRPYMERWFPDWANRIEYWHVGDLHIMTAEEALSVADVEVRALVRRLSSQPRSVSSSKT